MSAVKTKNEKNAIRETVREAYAARVEGGGCCGPTAGENASAELDRHRESALKMGYRREEIEAVPEGANLGLGCGAPLGAAGVRPGETVLDLGSGAGFDAFIAARAVGPKGRVIGVDMTPEMVAAATSNAARSGHQNVEFRQGLIEELPVGDEEVDVIVSNCVINLSPDKAAVFREAFRVLRPGGRLAVSDIVLTAPLPEVIADSVAAWIGCIAGASLLDDYLGFMRQAGFEAIEVVESRPAVESLPEDDPVVRGVLAGVRASCCGESSPSLDELARRVLSAKITAKKPSRAE